MLEVKNNFKSKYGENLKCPLCENHQEDQEHLLICPEIVSEVDTTQILYNDIFGTIEKQIEAVKIWKQKVRNSKLKIK